MAENSFVYVGYERSEYARSDDQPIENDAHFRCAENKMFSSTVCRLFDEGDIHRIEDKYGRKN